MPQKIDELTIRFPARAGYLTVARLNVAAVGSAAGFDVEELDDLRLAMNEAVSWLLRDEESGGLVELILSTQSGTVTIVGVRSGSGLPFRPLDDLIEAILGATVDNYELNADEGSDRRIRLVKTVPSTDGE